MARPAPSARGMPATPRISRPNASVMRVPAPTPTLNQGQVSETGDTLEAEVVQSIKSIERVVGSFGAMRENFSFHKDLVSELRGKLGEERMRRETVQRDIAAMERELVSERERADRAERLAQSSDAVIRELEHKLSALQSQTARLVKAITMLISMEVDASEADADGHLRLVS